MGYGNIRWFWGLIFICTVSCTYYKNEIYIPPVEEAKPVLEAEYVLSPPTRFNDPYWKTADYLTVRTANIEKELIHQEDGLLNMNNMIGGKADFNSGQDSELKLKAAYDNNNLYILASWQDKMYNASFGNWVYNGPKDPNKGSDPSGWTSQQNDDNIIFSFESTSVRDIWKWGLSISEPVGYAIDMHDSGSGWEIDSGDPVYERNAIDPSDNRSGPKYEWNGPQQELQRIPEINQSFAQLDPGYYILNETTFMGKVIPGDELYRSNCAFCHGNDGEGTGSFMDTETPLNVPAWLNRFTRDGLNSLIGNSEKHIGARYWNKLKEDQKIDIGARLRAFAGVPGIVLKTPTGSNADIRAYSNVILGNIDINKENKGYKVLIIRKLQTGSDDDVQFNLTQNIEYSMNIYLTDNDDLNLVGEEGKTLIFKSK